MRRTYGMETVALPAILNEEPEAPVTYAAVAEEASREEETRYSAVAVAELDEYAAVEPAAPAIDVYELRRQTEKACPFCGTGTAVDGPGLHPRWCEEDQGWHVCSVCRSVRRMGRRSGYRDIPDGWVIPVQFLKDRLFGFGRKRAGAVVDCSPMALVQAPGRRVFEDSLTITELADAGGRQYSELTCYSCVETSPDIEWVLRVLMARLAPEGVLRLSLLRSPFLSAPTPLRGWGAPDVVDIQHLPSAMGFECLLARVGLRVVQRRRTALLPIRPGSGVSGQMARVLNPWTVLRLSVLPAMNATSFGFGEELELERAH